MARQQTLDLLIEVRILAGQRRAAFGGPDCGLWIYNPQFLTALSSNGLGRRPLKAEIRVRFPLRLRQNPARFPSGIFVVPDADFYAHPNPAT
jgi:hypothetical protein